MKKLLLLTAAIMFFTIAANAQRPSMSGNWKPGDSANIAEIKQVGDDGRAYIVFKTGESHVGAGYWISPTQLKAIQTMHAGGGCTVDMSLLLTMRSADLFDLKYEFLEGKCGWNKGATGSTTLTRLK